MFEVTVFEVQLDLFSYVREIPESDFQGTFLKEAKGMEGDDVLMEESLRCSKEADGCNIDGDVAILAFMVTVEVEEASNSFDAILRQPTEVIIIGGGVFVEYFGGS